MHGWWWRSLGDRKIDDHDAPLLTGIPSEGEGDDEMKYVDVQWSGDEYQGGHAFDAMDYLAALPALLEQLPAGARGFVSDPDHFDFYAVRCVKDLQLQRMEHKGTELELYFSGNPWKHDEDLSLQYRGVTLVDYDHSVTRGVYERRPSVLLDEILPTDGGFSHEFALGSGDLTVVACDMRHLWVPRDEALHRD